MAKAYGGIGNRPLSRAATWILALALAFTGVLAIGPGSPAAAVATTTRPATQSTAPPLKPLVDNKTRGNWRGVYGASGHEVVGDTTRFPAGVSVSEDTAAFLFDAKPTDKDALQRDPGRGRVAAGRYGVHATATVSLPANTAYRLAVYMLDYNSVNARQQTVTLLDANKHVLSQVTESSFTNGRYLIWNITGTVTLDFQSTGYANGGYSGLFLDPVGTPGPRADNTPPTVKAQLAGKKLNGNNFAGPVTVTFRASDGRGYGVDHVTHALDGGTATDDTRPLWVTTAGHHQVTYTAVDFAGNVSAVGTISFSTTTVDVPSTPLRLIATNDFHGTLDKAAVQATTIKNLQSGHPDNAVFSVGDNYHFGPYESDFTRGEFTLEALGKMGVAASAVGNHEFDNGLAELQRLQSGGCDPTIGCFDHDGDGTPDRWNGTSFPYLAANVVDTTGKHPFPGSTVLTVNGQKIGVIGAVTEDTQQGIGYDLGLRFTPIAAAVNREAAKLSARGIKVIVALIHQGGSSDAACDHPGGPTFDINAHLSPAVDVIMSGHYHIAYNCTLADPDNQPRVVIAGSAFGVNLQLADLKISKATGDVDRFATTSSVVSTAGAAPDPAMTALVAQATKEADRRGNQPVAQIDADIAQPRTSAGKVDTTRENPELNLIADAELDYADQQYRGADLAVTYRGLSPNDLLYKRSGAETQDGIVTFHEAWLAQLYDFPIQIEQLTGSQILTLLQQQWPDTGSTPTYLLGVSKTVHYLRDPAGTTYPGHVGQVTIGGKALDPHKTYRIAVDSILSRGIAGIFPVFLDVKHKRNTGEPLREALIAYLDRTPVFHVAGLTGRMPSV